MFLVFQATDATKASTNVHTQLETAQRQQCTAARFTTFHMIVSASLLATLARHHRTVVLAVHVTECAQHLEAELSVEYPRDGQTDLACLRRRDTTIEVISCVGYIEATQRRHGATHRHEAAACDLSNRHAETTLDLAKPRNQPDTDLEAPTTQRREDVLAAKNTAQRVVLRAHTHCTWEKLKNPNPNWPMLMIPYAYCAARK